MTSRPRPSASQVPLRSGADAPPLNTSPRGARVRGVSRAALALVLLAALGAGCAGPPRQDLLARSRALESRAERLMLAGRWDQALEAWARVLGADPFAWRAHLERGRCYYELRAWKLELVEYRKALAINPGSPDALRRLGHALLGQDALEEARATYWRYLALVPDDARVLFNLSQVEAELGDHPASERLLARYRALTPAVD